MEDEERKKARKEGSETCLCSLRDEGENARAGLNIPGASRKTPPVILGDWISDSLGRLLQAVGGTRNQKRYAAKYRRHLGPNRLMLLAVSGT